ncbi:MAG: HAD family phosphatase [Myxococcota bacterium]
MVHPARSVVRLPPIECLIFDFDGVIVDSDPLHAEAYRRAFARHGIDMNEKDYVERAKGRGRGEVVALIGSALSDAARADVARVKTREARALIEEGGLAPVDSVVAFLRAARARQLPLAVASTSEIAGIAVEALGLTPLFDVVCARRAADRAKPHPDVFERAIHSLGRRSESCLVVEDTPVGVRAARACGAPVVVRGPRTDAWPAPIARDVLFFFDDYAQLHHRLGWGRLPGSEA